MTRVRIILLLLTAISAMTGCDETNDFTDGNNIVVSSYAEPFSWQARIGELSPGFALQPGQALTIPYDLNVDLRGYDKRYGLFTHLVVGVIAERRYDDEGFYRSGASTFALSSNFTTAGMPIERWDGWPKLRTLHGKDGSPIEAVQSFPLLADDLAKKHEVHGQVELGFPVDTPAGFYEVSLYAFVQVAGVKNPVHLSIFGYEWNDEFRPPSLPLIQIGEPATPNLPWSVLSEVQIMGRAGSLPEQYRGHAALCGRSGFPSNLILPPKHYIINPGFPFVFPRRHLPPVDGGLAVIPEEHESYLRYDSGYATCTLLGKNGKRDFGRKEFRGRSTRGPWLADGGFKVDLTQTGDYVLHLSGEIKDLFGRTFLGGGDYPVSIAYPMTFSTSCKPGCNFLVGDAYPGKVNLIPPFPAEVEVQVEYWPDSDPKRKQTWVGKGTANRFGHFIPYGQGAMVFNEPGEYASRVTSRYNDAGGRLWLGQQVSTGVIAAQEPMLVLHGTHSFPYNNRRGESRHGAVRRYTNRLNIAFSIMPETPYVLQDPFAPYYPQDTLFIPSNFSEENIIEPHLSMELRDLDLAAKLIEAYREDSIASPAWTHPIVGKWEYLKNVVQISTDSFAWFDATTGRTDEMPLLPVGADGYHPAAFPDKKIVEAYLTLGVVRPGFPVMTSIFQTEAVGLYWLASPNRYGFHFNTGGNGDLPGDVYRIQAGAVLRDLESGKNYYDVYGASIAVQAPDGEANSSSILGPGERALVRLNGREQKIFLALDPHDTLEVGEMMGMGGMVFPAVEADVTWTVTKPSGEIVVVSAIANRLGIARGKSIIPVDEPGLYWVKVDVRYEDLQGDIVGTPDGLFWHCAVPENNEPLLRMDGKSIQKINPLEGIRVPLSWPDDLRNVQLHFGIIMPGQVLDRGVVEINENHWEYPFEPMQIANQFSNFDVVNFGFGNLQMAETVVMQFFLQGERDGEKVFDSLRLFIRKNMLYNYRGLMQRSAHEAAGRSPH